MKRPGEGRERVNTKDKIGEQDYQQPIINNQFSKI